MTQGRYGDAVAPGLRDSERALLNTISARESNGRYNIRYSPSGGVAFSDFSQHPRVFERVPGQRLPSSAAGRYQIVATTWDGYENIHGGNFSPEMQDRVALQLAKDRYRRETGGRDLIADIETNGFTDETRRILGKEWAALTVNPGDHIDTYQDEFERISGQEAPFNPNPNLAPVTGDEPTTAAGEESGPNSAEETPPTPLTINWQENVLSSFENPSYYIKLYAASEREEDKFKNVNATADSTKDVKKIIIAETAVTGINIESLEINSTVSPNQNTKLITATEIRMRVFEPMGMSLYNKLRATARALGIFNFQKAPFYLEIRFLGYDAEGNHVSNIGPPPTTSKIWLYKVAITDITSEFTAAGSVYEITMVQYSDHASFDAHFALAAGFNPEGVSTIGNIIEQFVKSKHEAEIAQYGYQRNEYSIEFLPLMNQMADINIGSLGVSLNPADWTVTITSPDQPNQSASTTTPDTKTFSFSVGQNVMSFIEDLFASSEEGQKLIMRSTQANQPGDETEYVIVPFIIPEVEIRKDLPYDILIDDYNRKIKYTVTPFLTTRGILSPDQQEALKKRDQNRIKEKLQKRIETGKIEKRYDYLFTGLNTEVLKLDLKFDMLYKAIIPSFSGNNTIPAHSRNEVLSEDQIARDEYIAAFNTLKNTQRDIADLESRIRNLTQELSGENLDPRGESIMRRQLAEDQRRLAVEQARIPELNASVERTANRAFETAEERAAANRLDFEGNTYAEDISEGVAEDYAVVTIDTSTRDGAVENRGPESNSPQGQSLTTALLNQIKEPSMIEITFTIRGDPYWLGVTHCEIDYLNLMLNTGKGVAEFNNGDMNFLLKFFIPSGVDTVTGDPILKPEETFTGIYLVKIIKHSFNKGSFTQTIEAVRDINVDISLIENL